MEVGGGGSLVVGPVDLIASALARRGDMTETVLVVGLSYGRAAGPRP